MSRIDVLHSAMRLPAAFPGFQPGLGSETLVGFPLHFLELSHDFKKCLFRGGVRGSGVVGLIQPIDRIIEFLIYNNLDLLFCQCRIDSLNVRPHPPPGIYKIL